MDKRGYITLISGGRETAERIYERHRVLREILMRLGVRRRSPRQTPASWSTISATPPFRPSSGTCGRIPCPTRPCKAVIMQKSCVPAFFGITAFFLRALCALSYSSRSNRPIHISTPQKGRGGCAWSAASDSTPRPAVTFSESEDPDRWPV